MKKEFMKTIKCGLIGLALTTPSASALAWGLYQGDQGDQPPSYSESYTTTHRHYYNYNRHVPPHTHRHVTPYIHGHNAHIFNHRAINPRNPRRTYGTENIHREHRNYDNHYQPYNGRYNQRSFRY